MILRLRRIKVLVLLLVVQQQLEIPGLDSQWGELTMANSQTPTLALMCSLFLWGGEKIEMHLMDFDNDSFIRKAKAVLESKAERGICSPTPHWQADAMSLPVEQALSTHYGYLVRQRQWPQTSPRPSLFSECVAEHFITWPGISLGPPATAGSATSPANLLPTPRLLALCSAERKLCHCVCEHCSAIGKTLMCCQRFSNHRGKTQRRLSYCEGS